MTYIVCAYEGPEHRVIAGNAAFRAFAARDDVMGRAVAELFPGFAEQRLLAVMDQVYATGRSDSAREWRVAAYDSQADEPRELYLNFVTQPRRDASGAIIGVVGCAVDVTEQVHARHEERARTDAARHDLQVARGLVDQLQRALLPTELPVLPQLDISAHYLIAERDQAAGGDWFDAIPLPDGRVALVIGDVVGHGVAASAAMGQLRAVLQHALTMTGDLAAAVSQIDAYAARHEATRAATLAVVVVDQHTGLLEYTLSGHPPAIVITAAGRTRHLDTVAESQPLGVGHHHVVGRDQLDAGDIVLLYTDGLIERPGRSVAQGCAELAAVAADVATGRLPLDEGGAILTTARVCKLCVELLTRDGYDDDATALAAQLISAPPPTLSITVNSDSDGAAAALEATRTWLDTAKARPEAVLALELAVNEAIQNVIEHAYRGGRPAPLRITGELHADGVAEVIIGDDGVWRPPASDGADRSWGLSMVQRLIDESTVTTTPGSHPLGSGTVVTLRHHLTRPALVAPASSRTTTSSTMSLYASEEQATDTRVTLRAMGAVDTVNADRFAADVSRAARGGTVNLVIDLGPLTMLSSKGIRTLFAVKNHLRAQQRTLTLIAPQGTPARSALDLVALDAEEIQPT